MTFHLMNHFNHMSSKLSDEDRDLTHDGAKQFLLNLLDRVDGEKDGGTWINIEVSNIDVGSRTESYSIIARKDKA